MRVAAQTLAKQASHKPRNKQQLRAPWACGSCRPPSAPPGCRLAARLRPSCSYGRAAGRGRGQWGQGRGDGELSRHCRQGRGRSAIPNGAATMPGAPQVQAAGHLAGMQRTRMPSMQRQLLISRPACAEQPPTCTVRSSSGLTSCSNLELRGEGREEGWVKSIPGTTEHTG